MNVTEVINHHGNSIVTANVDGKRGFQRIFLRGGKLKARARGAGKTLT